MSRFLLDPAQSSSSYKRTDADWNAVEVAPLFDPPKSFHFIYHMRIVADDPARSKARILSARDGNNRAPTVPHFREMRRFIIGAPLGAAAPSAPGDYAMAPPANSQPNGLGGVLLFCPRANCRRCPTPTGPIGGSGSIAAVYSP